MSRSNNDLFRGWTATRTSPELKERVLSAVREGADVRQRKLTDRLWESRALRYGWAAAATALVALNLWLPTSIEPVPRSTATVQEPVDFDPVLASLVRDRLSPKTTWADQSQLAQVLLEEDQAVATDATEFGENS
jgi:hypothetical protein